MNIFSKYKNFFLVFSIVLIYTVQFILLPYILPQYYPISNEAVMIFLIPLIVYSVVIIITIGIDIKWVTIIDALYGLLLCIYHGKGYYGIGLRGLSLDGVSPTYSLKLAIKTILIIIIILCVFHAILRSIRLVFLKLKK